MNFLDVGSVEQLVADGVLLLDTRAASLVSDDYYEQSVCIPWGKNFNEVFQSVVADDMPVVLIAEQQHAVQIQKSILASGFSGLKGVSVESSFPGLKRSVIISIEPDEFAIDFNHDEFYLVDARKEEDFEQEHLEWAENIPLDDVDQIVQELSNDMRIYIVAENADNALTAASLFMRNGFNFVRAVAGAYSDFQQLNLPVVKAKKIANNKPSAE